MYLGVCIFMLKQSFFCQLKAKYFPVTSHPEVLSASYSTATNDCNDYNITFIKEQFVHKIHEVHPFDVLRKRYFLLMFTINGFFFTNFSFFPLRLQENKKTRKRKQIYSSISEYFKALELETPSKKC